MSSKSKTIVLEGLSPKTSISKLVFHLLEYSRLKKHQIGRIQKFPGKFSIEVIEQDQEDLFRIIQDLDGCIIDAHIVLAWSEDLEVEEPILEHFKKLEKWQMLEMEEEQKESTHLPFARIKPIDHEPSIQNSWIVEFEKNKTLQSHDINPKPGQPLVIVNTEDAKDKIHAIVIKWQSEFIKLNLDRLPLADDLENTKWNVSHSMIHAGMDRALQQIQRLPYQLSPTLKQLFQITLNHQEPEFEKSIPTATLSNDLNDCQQHAYLTCLEKPGMHLIQGPPGTGKSRVLLELLKAFHQDEKRVLVASSTHAAIDHLLQHCQLPEKDLLRLGHPSRIADCNLKCHLEHKWLNSESYQLHRQLQKEHRVIKRQFIKSRGEEKKQLLHELKLIEKSMQELLFKGKENLLDQSAIVFTTHTGFQPQFLKGHKFDVVLIDEAAQCSEIDIWLTMPSAKKWILAGDPYQLPTLVKSSKAKGLSISLLERLMKQGHEAHLLKEQYRMHSSIAEYSSHTFYQGQLKTAQVTQDEPIRFEKNSDSLFWVDHPQIFIDTAGSESQDQVKNNSHYNIFEADFLSRRVSELLEAGIVASDIGIISPYSAQTEYLKSLFKDVSPEISSVDSFQGREKKVIFISCVRSNHEGQIGFLADTRRMNVAMTRAKQLCIIIGDSATLANHAFYEAYLNYKEDTAGLHSVWEWSE